MSDDENVTEPATDEPADGAQDDALAALMADLEADDLEGDPDGIQSACADIAGTDAADDTAAATERAEANRARRTWAWLIAGGVVVVVGVLFAFWPVMQGRLDAVRQVDTAESLLHQAEGSLAPVDKLVTRQLSAEAGEAVPDTSAQLLVAKRELAQATMLVDGAWSHLTEDEQTRVTNLKHAIAARQSMAGLAPGILVASVKAVKAKAIEDQAAAAASQGYQSLGAAQVHYAKQTPAEIASAVQLVPVMREQFTQARSLYSQVASAYPGFDYSQAVVLVDLDLQQTAVIDSALKAWLAGDQAGAKATYAQLGPLDTKYQQLWAKVSRAYETGGLTGQGFRKLEGAAVDSYQKARKQADVADKALSSQ